MRGHRTILACVTAMALGCQIVDIDTDAGSLGPAILLSVSPDFAEVLQHVDHMRLEITKPGAAPRDTVFLPRVRDGRLRVSVVLRPDEGEPGTEITVTLSQQDFPLFSGTGVLGPQTGWPFEGLIQLDPIATLDLQPSDILIVEESLALSDLTPIIFVGRQWSTSQIVWLSTDEAILEIVGDQAHARATGIAALVAGWNGQVDTMTVEVFPKGIIVVSTDPVLLYVGPSDQMADTVAVESGPVGGVGRLQVTADPTYPWLSAELSSETPPTNLVIHVDGPSLPYGAPMGEVTISSDQEGVSDVVVRVDARGEPSTGVETRSWNPFCVISANRCINLQARAWTEGDMRRVVLEIRGLDPGSAFSYLEVYRFGIQDAALETFVEGLQVRPSGPVGVINSPRFVGGGSAGRFLVRSTSIAVSAVIGCGPIDRALHAVITCDSLGFTGSLRADFQVADPSWSLASAVATLRGRFGSFAAGFCTEGDGTCAVQ